MKEELEAAAEQHADSLFDKEFNASRHLNCKEDFKAGVGWLLSNPPDVFYVPVSVGDELPPKGEQVTCLLSKDVGLGTTSRILYRMKHNGKWNDYNDYVTHWLKKLSLLDIKK